MSAYDAAGVDYATLDAGKRKAIAAAFATSMLPAKRGARVADASRGEPAVVVSIGRTTIAVVLECLGTKSMIARQYQEQAGVDLFDAVGWDTVAAAVNDLCCVGALPVVVNAYFATGSASWYEGGRHDSLVTGWAAACEESGAAWGGGESPTLNGLVLPDEIDLAASAVGVVSGGGGSPWLGDALAPGDEMVVISSSGLHANGASLARRVADTLPRGLACRLPSGRSFGEALLDRTLIYTSLVERLQEADLPVTYVSHITGHGWRKVMRADRQLTYRVDRLPEVPEVLTFLAQRAGMDAGEAYGTLNMGAGLVVYVARGAARRVVAASQDLGLSAVVAGRVEEGPRRVVLEPLGVEYAGSDLELR